MLFRITVNGMRIFHGGDSSYISLNDYASALSGGGGKVIAVIGDMLELGHDSKMHHKKIGELIAASNISRVFAVGPESKMIVSGAISAGFDNDKIIHCEWSRVW